MLLNELTETEGFDRRFRDGPGVRRLDEEETSQVCAAFDRYLETIPQSKRFRPITYTVKDVVGRSGYGIGSAGLPAYNVLIEGFNEALDNDIVLSMKQGNVAAPSRVVTDERIASYFHHHGHRTAESQRALQAHADPLLGYTELGDVGFVVSELSPYQTDLDWIEATEPTEIAPCSTTSAGPPRRCTVCPTPTRTPLWSTSRPRTPSSAPSATAAGSSATGSSPSPGSTPRWCAMTIGGSSMPSRRPDPRGQLHQLTVNPR